VKAAVLNSKAEVLAVYQEPCPLWKGLDQLRMAVRNIQQKVASLDSCHAITMTGELVDFFEDRNDGVKQIIATMLALLSPERCLFYAGTTGFLEGNQINATHYQSIASANWLASASVVAQKKYDGLFVDIGSTTTDILLFREGQVQAEGYTDYQRLISQELIYTGIIRTAIMAVAQAAVDQNQVIGIMAEYFATMVDVYRVTEELDERHDQAESADGAEKTKIASARRLSRMIGSDFYPEELPRWRQFAENIRAQQLQKIQRACEYRLQRKEFSKPYCLIGAGVGRFLVRHIAQAMGCTYIDFSELFQQAPSPIGLTVADCAPAVAVAWLSRDALNNDYQF
jgi:probable H4MPT-linked C1 transfer pathway protein